jgi:hypothetical protein
MHKTIEFTIRGISPLMLHNGALADPLNEFAKRLKEISGKRNKTEADYRAMADIEWEGGLYFDEDHRIVMPGENIEAAITAGGKKFKLGDQCKAGILSDGDWPIIYEGPKDLEKLKADPRFRDCRGVKIQKNRIMRTRPLFVPWGLKFTVQYLPDLDQVVKILDTVGRIIGLGDFKPKYGRFTVEKAA